MSHEGLEITMSMYDQLLIPAEESLKDMNDLFKKEKDIISKLKDEINKTEDPKKQKDLLTQCIKEMKIIRSQIQTMDESSFDKAKRNIINAISLGVIIASGLMVGIKTKSVGAGVGTSITTGVVGGVSSMKIDEAKIKKGTKKYSKSSILWMIDEEIKWYTNYVKLLNNPKFLSYLNKGNGTNMEKIETAFDRYGEENIGKLMKGIISDINSIMTKYISSKYTIKLKWMYTVSEDWYSIHLDRSSSDKVESIYRDPSKEEQRMLDDIACKFGNVMYNQINNKYKLSNYGFCLREQSDEYCEMYIEKDVHL